MRAYKHSFANDNIMLRYAMLYIQITITNS